MAEKRAGDDRLLVRQKHRQLGKKHDRFTPVNAPLTLESLPPRLLARNPIRRKKSTASWPGSARRKKSPASWPGSAISFRAQFTAAGTCSSEQPERHQLSFVSCYCQSQSR